MANVSAEVNAVLDHAERVNEVAERYKAEAERNRIEAENARAELARERSRRDYEDPRAYEVAERYARLTEDSLRVLHNERAARLRAEELRMSPPVVAMPPPIEYISAPVQITAAPVHVAPMTVAAPPNTDGYRIADLEHLLRAERDKVTFLMLEKDRLENLLEAEKQRHEYEKDIMTDELEYRGQEKRYWQWWSSEERQELASAKSTAEQLRAEADRMRMDLLAEREARQRAERALEEYRLVADRSAAELEQRITRSAEDMVNNYRRVIDTLEKQLEVYRRQAMENEVKMRELTVRAEWGRARQEPELASTSVTSYSHVASSLAPGKETTSVSQYVRAESPVRAAPPPPLLSASIGNNGTSYFADQLLQLRRERDEAYSALARYEDPIIRTNDHLLSSSSLSRPMGGAYSPPRLGSPRRRFEEMSRRVTRLSPTKY